MIQVLTNICRNFGSERHSTVNAKFDPTACTTYSIYVVMDDGLGDTKQCYLEHPNPDNPEEWIEDKSIIVGAETGAYRLEIISLWGDGVKIKNIETNKVIVHGLYSDNEWKWFTDKEIKPEDMEKILEHILTEGWFYGKKPENYKCTCERRNGVNVEFDQLCPLCQQQEIEEADAALMRMAE